MQSAAIDIPFFGVVFAGFPSPAADYMEEDIDLKKILQANLTSIYWARVKGNSMIGDGIPDNAIVIIDKSIKARHNNIVVATLNGERLIKRLVKTHGGVFLAASNPGFIPIRIDEDSDFKVWGVVTHIIINTLQGS